MERRAKLLSSFEMLSIMLMILQIIVALVIALINETKR